VPEFIAGDDTDEGEWLAIAMNANFFLVKELKIVVK